MKMLMKGKIVFCVLSILLANFAYAQEFVVKSICIVPTDALLPDDNVINRFKNVVEDVRYFYEKEMERHGYGSKTFHLETDKEGKPVFEVINGKYSKNEYMGNTADYAKQDLPVSNNVYIALIAGVNSVASGWRGTARITLDGSKCGGCRGFAYIADRDGNFEFSTVAHELGHAFGLWHNLKGKNGENCLMWNGDDRLDKDEARWLNKSPYFNSGFTANNPPKTTRVHNIEQVKSDGEDFMMLKIDVAGVNGLYQAQVFRSSDNCVVAWDELRGLRDTAEFMIRKIDLFVDNTVFIQFMDDRGNQNLHSNPITIPLHIEKVKPVLTFDDNITYLTLDYSGPNALVPTNARAEWTGWNNLIREKTPDGQLPEETQPFSDRSFWTEWDYWFYSHAQSHIVYNLTGGKYAVFDAYFHMPNPCGSIASVEVILVADNDPIYNSGILRADQAQSMNISVDIPAGTRELSIYVTDAGDGIGCDHFIFANARLVHGDSLPRKVGPKIAGPKITGPKITGPWLWMLVPTGGRCGAAAAKSEMDFLAEASGGRISEIQVATHGVMEGDTTGDHQWTSAKISPIADDNINVVMNAIGLGVGDIQNHVAYGCITLDSPMKQDTTMYVGSDDAVKVWLNGTLVHNNPIDRPSYDYQDNFPVILEQGTNILLVAVYECSGGWTGFFGFEKQAEYTVLPPRLGFSFSTTTTNVRVGDTFMLHLNSEKVTGLAGWQFDIVFDPVVLEALEVSEGDFLKKQDGATFFRRGRIDNAAGKITGLSSALISANGVSGTGTILSVTFSAKAIGETQVTLRNFEFGSVSGQVIPVIPYEIIINVGDQPAWDVNQDGRVSILDLILVAQRLGEKVSANSKVDVNDDGVISILDLIIIAQHMGESTAAAPSAIAIDSVGGLNSAMLQAWIERAHIEDNGSIAFRQGIANLQRLLESLIPERTTLLANYPNPFNPETWIPYQLAESAEVSISIYATDGKLVRTLELGHQFVGIYESRSHAAYWDGKNEVGESVASGIYFYTLRAGDFVGTRKMLIMK